LADDIVVVKNLSKTFKGEETPALSGITLNLRRGELAALVGPDGAGKTTFLRILCGLLNKNVGEVLIDGISPFNDGKNADKTGVSNNVKKIIGYMPQKFGLYEDLSVIENLNLFVTLNGALGEVETIDTLLEFAGLKDFKTRLAGNLSGGMKQKLGLCCTLISKPKLLLLDEPSVGVDPLSRLELMEIVKKLVTENGISVIWSTSYLDEAEKFERVFLLSEGKKIYDGPPKGTGDESFEEFVINKMIENRQNALKEADLEKMEAVFLSDIPAECDETICASDLTKVYGKGKNKFTAANNITFSIKKGEIFGLLGPNGAGKSTTFKMLCGLIRQSSGYSSIMGVRMDENPSLARSYLGYMAQKFSLFGDLSVRQNLNFFAGVYGLAGFSAKRRIKVLLELFDLKKYEDMNAKELPLGYKQRLSLSCAIVHNPPVLFLDEPTSGVDPLSRKEFWEQIRFLSKRGTTVLVTTHFMDEAQFCQRISFVYKGNMLVCDTPDNLKNLIRTEEKPNPTMEDVFIELILREREALNSSGSADFGGEGSAK